MDASRAKARSTRKSRPSDGGRGAKAARPVHPAKGMAGRVPRVVKARAGQSRPIPANDTMPLPAEELGLPVLPDVEIAVVEAAAASAAAADGRGGGEGEASEAAAGRRGRRGRPGGRRGRGGGGGGRGGDDRQAQARATTSRRASSRCTSATWRSWTSCVPSRSSRPRATSSRWSWTCGERSSDSRQARAGSSTSSSASSASRLPEAKLHRAAAERARQQVVDPGAQPLREDRCARSRPSCGCSTSTASSSTRRWPRFSASVGPRRACPIEGTIPFSTSTKAFADYVRVGRRQGVPPQGGEERVREGEPAPGGVDRAPVQPRAPAARRPDPGGQHRPDEGGRALRLPPRLPLLDLRELVDSARDQPRAGRQGARGAPAGAHDRRLSPHREVTARAAVEAGASADARRRSPRRRASRPTSSRR